MFMRGIVSYAQAQGPRELQEDYLVHVPFTSLRVGRGHLLGVLDGHGGEDVAKYCAEMIPRLYNPAAPDIEEELRNLTRQLDSRTRLAENGTTLSLAHISESARTATVLSLGDSPVIVIDGIGGILLSEQHNVLTNPIERDAVVRRGGVYQSGYIRHESGEDGLQVSRSLGDREFASLLDRTPAVRSYRLSSVSLVLVASDGLFDAEDEISNRADILTALQMAEDGGDANDILRWKMERGLEDNASVIVWKPRAWWNWF